MTKTLAAVLLVALLMIPLASVGCVVVSERCPESPTDVEGHPVLEAKYDGCYVRNNDRFSTWFTVALGALAVAGVAGVLLFQSVRRDRYVREHEVRS